MRKKLVLSYELFFEYGGEGDRLASLALRAAHSLRSWSVQLAAPVVEPRSGLLIPTVQYAKKLALSYELFFKYGGEGDRLASLAPAGSPLTVFVVCPTGCASCRTPVGASHPHGCNMRKSSHFRTSSSLNMAVRGIDSLRSPCGQPTHCVRGLSNWLRQLSNPGRGFSSPRVQYAKKLALSYELFFKYGGEGDSNPDTLPYTHFPCVLLQPLGHLTKLFCCQTSWVATGRYYRELE